MTQAPAAAPALLDPPARPVPRVAVVTGAGTGIGAATARLLAAGGWHVTITGRRADMLEALADAVAADHPAAARLEPRPLDVRDPAACAALVAEVQRAHGRLDGIVLNAGIVGSAAVEDQTDDEWSDILRTNLDGALFVVRAALPLLERSAGSVVAVSSVGARVAASGGAAYSASKAALQMLVATIAVEYGRRGVRANCVAPGWVRTEMADAEMSTVGAQRGIDRQAAYLLATALVPQRRPGEPREIAEAIAWLLSPAASYVTGAVLAVDGGLSVADPGMAALE